MRTSLTHPIYVTWFKHEEEEGKIGMTLCPGKYQPVSSTGAWDRQLDVDLDALSGMGIHRLISLITEEDMEVLRVKEIGRETLRRGITWNHFPIPDSTVPRDAWVEQAIPIILELVETIPKGHIAVVHCMGGLSRAGLFVALFLFLSGMNMDEAIWLIRALRSPHCINKRQEEWLYLFTFMWASGNLSLGH